MNYIKRIIVAGLLILTGCSNSSKTLTSFGNTMPSELLSTKNLTPGAGYTMASSSNSHGIQIGYWGEDGKYALWYPGNKKPLLGTWRKRVGSSEYCFSYRVNTWNPALKTHSRAGTETCGFIPNADWVAKKRGDVFNLMSGKLPNFDLTRCVLPEPLVLRNDMPCRPK